MPIYDFKCPKCGEEIKDAVVRVDENGKMPPSPYCPKCCETMERVFPTNTSFQLRGSGWTGKTRSGG